jgi:hypothetical protein
MSKLFKQEADLGALQIAEQLPTDFAVPPLSTGTVDDDDDPVHERSGENEAPVREKNENTDTSDEFQYNDEDRVRS